MNAGINLARFPSLGAILSLPPGGWSGTDVPLAQRGVRTSWLVRFVRDLMDDINRPRSEAIVQAERAVNHNKPGRWGLHDQPDIEIPAIPKYTLLNVRSLVEHFVLPLTVELRAPLWALRAGKAARRSHLTDMEAVVAEIGKVVFPATPIPILGRIWCLWELLCDDRVSSARPSSSVQSTASKGRRAR